MAWDEARAWLSGTLNEKLYQNLLDDALAQPARALVIKTKPMYLFMNMLFQHTVQKRPKTPSPTQGNFVPRDEEEDFNHAAE